MNKLSKSILALVIGISTLSIKAQEKEFNVSSKRNEDKSITLTAEKSSPGTYTVVLNFRELDNTSLNGDPIYEVKHNNDNFLTLTPINKEQNIGYSFSYSFIRGKLNPKYSPLFLYALPYPKDKKVKLPSTPKT